MQNKSCSDLIIRKIKWTAYLSDIEPKEYEQSNVSEGERGVYGKFQNVYGFIFYSN